MKVIDEVLAQITEHRWAGSSELLAKALKSACTAGGAPGPSLHDIAGSLDDVNFARYCRLARLRFEPDFDTAAIDYARAKLVELGFDTPEQIFYSIPVDAGSDARIEVYGDGSMGWYEWRLMKRGQIEHDTRQAGYGNPDVALRDALCYVYGPPDELEQLDQAIGRAQRGETPKPK